MNLIKTGILLAALTAFFGWIGYMVGGQSGMLMALGVAAAMNIGSWWFSDKMVLSIYGAQPVTSGPVYDMTRELATRANLPIPKVYVLDQPQPNAFATGRNPHHAAVAVTSGIMRILNERELRGVIAHELAHIKNRDTLTMTVAATIAGAIGMLMNFLMFFGGSHQSEENRSPLSPIVAIAAMILAPLAASLVQMTISRVREYEADKDGAEICGDPLALASALQKLERGAQQVDNIDAENNPATAHMFIVNPLHTRKTDGLFSTHPATANRIAQLEQLAGTALTEDFSSDRTPNNPWD